MSPLFHFLKSVNQQKRRGMTLTELAIALGIMGAILGGIWAASYAVNVNMRVADMTRDLITITQNVRELYKAQSNFTKSTGTDMTETFIKAEVFPASMIDDTLGTPVTPWGTDVKIYVGDTSKRFRIEYISTLPESACRSLVGRVAGEGASRGLVNVTTSGSAYTSPDDITNLTATALSGSCDSVSFTFNLKG